MITGSPSNILGVSLHPRGVLLVRGGGGGGSGPPSPPPPTPYPKLVQGGVGGGGSGPPSPSWICKLQGIFQDFSGLQYSGFYLTTLSLATLMASKVGQAVITPRIAHHHSQPPPPPPLPPTHHLVQGVGGGGLDPPLPSPPTPYPPARPRGGWGGGPRPPPCNETPIMLLGDPDKSAQELAPVVPLPIVPDFVREFTVL